MNAKISVFVICFEAIVYVLLYNLHDCTFKIPGGIYITLIKSWLMVSFSSKQMWHAIPAKVIIIHAHQFQFL